MILGDALDAPKDCSVKDFCEELFRAGGPGHFQPDRPLACSDGDSEREKGTTSVFEINEISQLCNPCSFCGEAIRKSILQFFHFRHYASDFPQYTAPALLKFGVHQTASYWQARTIQ
jgi:hypothetical protein